MSDDVPFGEAVMEAMRDAAWKGEMTQLTVKVEDKEGNTRGVRVIVVPEIIEAEPKKGDN